MKKGAASKLLFSVKGPVTAKVYRARFEPFAATEFIDTRELKKAAKVSIECGTLDVAGKSFTLLADVRKGVITGIRPKACAECAPKKSKKPVGKSAAKDIIKAVNLEMAKRKLAQPSWPVGVALKRSLGFRIPFGPIVIVIGTDPDEGIDTFDCCIIINTPTSSCIYCVWAPSACVGFPG